MPFIYSADREKVQLELSPNDIGIRFENYEATCKAVKQLRSDINFDKASPETIPACYDRVMLLHESGAARTAFAAARNALPSNLLRTVRRTAPVFIDPVTNRRMIASREITVRFKARIKKEKVNKVLSDFSLKIRRSNDFIHNQYVVVSSFDIDETVTLDTANALAELDEIIEMAVPNFVSEYKKGKDQLVLPKDPMLDSQWHLNNDGSDGSVAGEDVNAFDAWKIVGGGSRDIVIAIVDDGVDCKHPDLKNNIWINPDLSAPDRNGRNFYDDNYDPNPKYFREPYSQLSGNDSHGTPCAGVAAAVGDNKKGVIGIAYNCRILPVKIFGADDLAPDDKVADAIRYAGERADVISCSWSGPRSTDLEMAINDVTTTGRKGKGCLVFCATGNEYNSVINFPASHPRSFAIGASNDNGTRSDYSNYGEGLDFVAPSNDKGRQGITTTDISLRNRGFNLKGSYTDDFGGTSSATPLAAGIGALILSAKPKLTWEQARKIMRETAEKIDKANGKYRKGYSLKYGYGRLDAAAAVTNAKSR